MDIAEETGETPVVMGRSVLLAIYEKFNRLEIQVIVKYSSG